MSMLTIGHAFYNDMSMHFTCCVSHKSTEDGSCFPLLEITQPLQVLQRHHETRAGVWQIPIGVEKAWPECKKKAWCDNKGVCSW